MRLNWRDRHRVAPHASYFRRYLPFHEARAFARGLRLGVKCPQKEIEALTKGDRVEAFFICPPGTPGSLCFCHGREQWLPEPSQESAEWAE